MPGLNQNLHEVFFRHLYKGVAEFDGLRGKYSTEDGLIFKENAGYVDLVNIGDDWVFDLPL